MTQSLRVFDHSTIKLEGNALLPFAFEELLCREVGDGKQASIHFWRHAHACILGMRDRQLPHASDAIAQLQQAGYDIAVRQSGGAFVPLDEGVLNFSIVLPIPEGKLSYQEDFERMATVIAQACATFKHVPSIAIGEVAGSYCPGSYDMSVHGRKFCGIAQRRQTKAHIVHAFLLVDGHAQSRAQLARDYYEQATDGTLEEFPIVNPDSMVSLNEFDQQITVESLSNALVQALVEFGFHVEEPYQQDWHFSDEQLAAMCETLQSRYNK